MKNTLLALTSLALGSTAFAGTTDYVSSNTQQMTSSPLYQWFAGGSVGYLEDTEEAFYTAHFGTRFAGSGPVSHSLYAEVGYTSQDALPLLDVDIVPVTLNYKLDYYFTERFSVYAGGGLGAAFVDAKTPFGDDDDVSFTAQVFAGVGYDFTPAFQIYGGARYIWIDDSSVFGIPVDAGDDLGAEVGLRFRF